MASEMEKGILFLVMDICHAGEIVEFAEGMKFLYKRNFVRERRSSRTSQRKILTRGTVKASQRHLVNLKSMGKISFFLFRHHSFSCKHYFYGVHELCKVHHLPKALTDLLRILRRKTPSERSCLRLCSRREIRSVWGGRTYFSLLT